MPQLAPGLVNNVDEIVSGSAISQISDESAKPCRDLRPVRLLDGVSIVSEGFAGFALC